VYLQKACPETFLDLYRNSSPRISRDAGAGRSRGRIIKPCGEDTIEKRLAENEHPRMNHSHGQPGHRSKLLTCIGFERSPPPVGHLNEWGIVRTYASRRHTGNKWRARNILLCAGMSVARRKAMGPVPVRQLCESAMRSYTSKCMYLDELFTHIMHRNDRNHGLRK
jgi:hypothetical protein